MSRPRQTLLPGFAPATATDRLFLALFPEADTAAKLAAFAATQCAVHGLRGRPPACARLHVTLFHLGDSVGLRQDVVAAATLAASRLKAAPFELSFDQVASFGGRRDSLPFVLKAGGGNAPLRTFHAALAAQLREVGLTRFTGSAFDPHLTLAYDARTISAEPVTPVGWRVHEFMLVHSLLGKTRYITLQRWSLGPA